MVAISGCKSQNLNNMEYQHTNQLIHSTSPYLLQHAHNPVNWQSWSDKIPELAKMENKLILVSIGYAACHWCHVMEHECFENAEVAKLMNDNFICVKVDREERPDVDNYYMTAVQLMQQQGGWPLNVIALPDGRPIWGGTYFPKLTWMENLKGVSAFYRQNRTKTEEYAANLQLGIEQTLLNVNTKNTSSETDKLVDEGVSAWKKRFDLKNGGRIGAPKFPMPTNLDFLLYYGFIKNDNSVLDFVETTLEKMSRGGIYDQLGGGFARYSVDEYWKVPHFEKMLYDNGQLLSLYSKGFQQFKNSSFKNVVYETVDFLERELMDKSGAFYSSLDADTEGEEGKFYVWNSTELSEILKNDFALFSDYYNVNGKGFWELGNNILLREDSDENFAKKHDLSESDLEQKVQKWKNLLMIVRSARIRPGLDDKTLTSWNALVIQGLTDAYKAFRDQHFLDLAIKNAIFLIENVMQENGKLFHNWKNREASVDGFLEDYALLIQAYLSLFEVTANEKWLNLAVKLTSYTFTHFYEKKVNLFYFSEISENPVLTNHFQKEDNVIPAANSIMANNLHRLYLIFGKPDYLEKAKKMLFSIISYFPGYPMAYSNWGNLMLKINEPHFEVAVCSENPENIITELQKDYRPNVLWIYASRKSEVPILQDRFLEGKNLIYVCKEGVCNLPVNSVENAMKLLKASR